MADIFFSYQSNDRERVRPIHDALEVQGFEVFWDQEVPLGKDWDSWIRQHLRVSKCAVVFWSSASVASKMVRHEATVADGMGKLVSVLLESLTPDQFPMGMYTTQAINLADLKGDFEQDRWKQFLREIKTKLMPTWAQQQIVELEAGLHLHSTRRLQAEVRENTWKEIATKEADSRRQLEQERDEAVVTARTLKSIHEEINIAKSESETRVSELLLQIKKAEDQISQEREHAANAEDAHKFEINDLKDARSKVELRAADLLKRLYATEGQVHAAQEEVTALNKKISELQDTIRTLGSQPSGRSFSAKIRIFHLMSVISALMILSFWAYRPVLNNEWAQRTAKVEELEAQINALKLAKSDSDKKVNDFKIQADGLSRAKGASDIIVTDLTQRLNTYQYTPQFSNEKNEKNLSEDQSNVATSASFEIKSGIDIGGSPFRTIKNITINDCRSQCSIAGGCNAFSFAKASSWCYLHAKSDQRYDNQDYDSGFRNLVTLETPKKPSLTQGPSPIAGEVFNIKNNTEIKGNSIDTLKYISIEKCQTSCIDNRQCSGFSFAKSSKWCYLYNNTAPQAENKDYVSGFKNR
ncbi:TIR domain-containing protein [Methylobacterium sp. EM32]|uniref:TIR domain-containing protein n=1 Tax=Methylobacterium sp. EM32 TaxID=3163481 RepID=UPI0033B0B645